MKQEAPEGSRGVASNNRAKPRPKGAGKMEALSERQRIWQRLFKPGKPLRVAGIGSRSVGKGAMGREEIRIQTISRSLLHPVVSANSI